MNRPVTFAAKALLMNISNSISTAQSDLAKLISDLRGLMGKKEFDPLPSIKVLRQKLDDGVQITRNAAVSAAQDATAKAKDTALATDRYAHDEPWRIAGAALAVGILVGVLMTRR